MLSIVRNRSAIYLTAIFFSLLLSYWISAKETVINPDAICYLQSAAMMNLGVSQASHLCPQASWPFYSGLIYLFTSATNVLYIHSAYILNAIFSLLSVIAFMSIIHFLKSNARILWFAAGVILLSHQFNDVKQYIVRDHGFWAFYLLSIFFLLHFFREFSWRYALGWSVSLFIATLFRLEGAFFLLLMPFSVWFFTQQTFFHRLQSFLKLNAIPIIIFVLLSLWFLVHPHVELSQVGRLAEIKFRLLHGLSVSNERFQMNANALSEHILNSYSEHDATLLLFLVIIIWFAMNVIGNLSLPYTILVIYTLKQKLLTLQKSDKLVLWGYISINISITLLYLFQNMFLSKRYLLALSLTFMIWIPFALEALYLQWQHRKWPLLLALGFIVMSSLGGIFTFGHSKTYIRDAGQWLEKNIPQQASLYSNDIQVMYYSQHFGNQIFEKARNFKNLRQAIVAGEWKHYDYIALRSGKNDVEKMTSVLGKPMQVFANKRGDNVSIYKIQEGSL